MSIISGDRAYFAKTLRRPSRRSYNFEEEKRFYLELRKAGTEGTRASRLFLIS
jgi:hypothetical protein